MNLEGLDKKMAKNILIIEDEYQIIKLISVILSKKGFEIDYCENGRDAIAKMHKVKPDLIIMDIMLPGIDGQTLTKQMSKDKSLSHIPVLIISSLKDAETLFRDTSQIKGFISKPFTQDVMLEAVEKILPV